MTDRPALPDWPALMDVELARLYMGGMSVSVFHGLANQHGVRPVDLGRRLSRWKKADLDRIVDSLQARGADLRVVEPAEADSVATAADRALERVAQRAAQRGRRRR